MVPTREPLSHRVRGETISLPFSCRSGVVTRGRTSGLTGDAVDAVVFAAVVVIAVSFFLLAGAKAEAANLVDDGVGGFVVVDVVVEKGGVADLDPNCGMLIFVGAVVVVAAAFFDLGSLLLGRRT